MTPQYMLRREGIYELGEGVTLEWLANGRIAALALPNMSQKVVEVFIDARIALIKAWNPDEMLLVMLVADKDESLTKYMRKRVEDMLDTPDAQHVQTRVAVVLKKSLFGNITETFTEQQTRRSHNRLIANVFFDRAGALAWLEKWLPPED